MALKERCLNPAQPDRRMLAIESKWSNVHVIAKQADPIKRRFLSGIAEQARNHINANRHQMDKMFPGWKLIVEGAKSRMSPKQLAAREQVVAADIATFTTQIVDTVVDSYEQDILFDITTMRVMNGPTAFVLTETETQLDAADSGFYEAGSNLADGIDPDYLDCPAECATGKRVGYENALTTITAVCKRGWSDASLTAQQDAVSQFNLDLMARLQSILQREIRREWQAEAIALMIANAGAGNVTWVADAPAGAPWTSLDPKVWKETLFLVAWMEAAANIFGNADNREREPNFAVGDVRTMRRFGEMKSFSIDSALPGLAPQRPEEFSNLFGTLKTSDASFYRLPLGIAANTLLVGLKRDDKPGQLQLPFVDMFAIEEWTDPETACTKIGAQSRHGQHTSRPGYFSVINITPEV